MKKRFTEEQIAFALRQAEGGTPVTEVMTSMGLMSGLSLGVVIRPVVLLSLIFSKRSVRSKRGQLHREKSPLWSSCVHRETFYFTR